MIEILLGLGLFLGIALLVLVVVFVVPMIIDLVTKSEGDSDHLYTIFMEESGYRGHKVLSAAGCLFPFILLTKSSNDIGVWMLVVTICATCFLCHLSVYKHYPVLTNKMKVVLAIMLGFLAVMSFLVRVEILSKNILVFILVASGLIWGGYAVFRRSLLVRIARRS
ncbi:hypothetical protein QP938_06295 [Porticoccaceae bacterium LTM1]|nr:hypothetical protein QP938_06295 [Porticoccaceae bacterium LTM1]